MVKQIISYLNHNIALYQCHEQGNETPEEGTGDEMEKQIISLVALQSH